MSIYIQLLTSTRQRMQKIQRSNDKLNHLSLEAEKPIFLASLDDKKSYDSAQVLIKQSRRKNYIVFLPLFLRVAKDALKEGNFSIVENPYFRWKKDSLKHMNKRTKGAKNMLLHSNKWCINVRMDLVYGADENSVERNQQVDICGAAVNAHGCRAIDADPELYAWVQRVVQLKMNTHYPCITTGCCKTFSVNNPRDRKYICDSCGTGQCPKCQIAWEAHDGITCFQVEIRSSTEKLADPFIKDQLFKGLLQACPGCGTLTDKTEGCNKVVCSKPGCSEFWCWGCGTGNLRSLGDPYSHFGVGNCPVNIGVFAEDADSIMRIRTIISKRNIGIYGDLIRPASADDQPITREEADRLAAENAARQRAANAVNDVIGRIEVIGMDAANQQAAAAMNDVNLQAERDLQIANDQLLALALMDDLE